MKTLKNGIIPLFLLFTSISLFSQEPLLTKKDSTVVSSWMFGIGYHFIDDSGDVFDAVLDIDKSWHALSYPSRISIGKYFKNGLGIEAIGAYMKYKEGKKVDGLLLSNYVDFWSLDARLSYDLNKVLGETGWFDPYIGVGAGYTDANNLSRGTWNGVLGFRTWFNDNIGLDINSSGKWSMDGTATNYIQHVVGVVFRFSEKKDLTKKGREKLELINQLEQEKIRVSDSIKLAAKAKVEQEMIAQKQKEEAERKRLEQIEKDKEAAKQKKIAAINEDIQGLEKLYFSFDSSGLSNASKTVLEKWLSILRKYPDVTIDIRAHTDSRGSATYNKRLSQERFETTVEYLIKNGIARERITGDGYGEEQLTNECDDNTKCSEVKHKENRRSEFKVKTN